MHKGTKQAQGNPKKEKAVLEAGFSNYFSGANHERALQKDKELRDRSKSRTMAKQADDGPRRGWHDRGATFQEASAKNVTRASADRYSAHSEDEETEPSNKVGFMR
jgi:hypothetical protein